MFPESQYTWAVSLPVFWLWSPPRPGSLFTPQITSCCWARPPSPFNKHRWVSLWTATNGRGGEYHFVNPSKLGSWTTQISTLTCCELCPWTLLGMNGILDFRITSWRTLYVKSDHWGGRDLSAEREGVCLCFKMRRQGRKKPSNTQAEGRGRAGLHSQNRSRAVGKVCRYKSCVCSNRKKMF